MISSELYTSALVYCEFVVEQALRKKYLNPIEMIEIQFVYVNCLSKNELRSKALVFFIFYHRSSFNTFK
ncbi:hypothetical protein AYI68_g1811 [Smittium mucronatum]|uniref:Uncharacterized protein n=1 Tax=Smittium mucronatum TaxID=133383 RepID=A0A1R0GT28_9FUNG|nr:hypothetical protein AYI68_g5874 [Smittium mucronatum]OLY81030.1 hypothetical protein AYI68_g4869 [Smittium mucronatum]OLY84032.1 hypothetical protein AYI68_g1811 [Smittium mucronatum]